MATDSSPPNAQQIEYWNDQAGPRWVALQEALDRQIEPLGLQAMDRADVSPGERVVDVGCGCGQTSLELASRVGETGHVHGVDISGPMLARARERATQLAQVDFTQADAQTHPFVAGDSDLLFSRFGVMFFEDPGAAFANLRRTLRPDGRLTFLCWQSMEHNPWMRVPVMALAELVELPPPPPPEAPGPMAFADPDRLRGLFSDAGYRDVTVEPLVTDVTLAGGASLEEAAEFMLQIGPVVRVAKAAGLEDLTPLKDKLVRTLEPYLTPDGVRLGAGMWIYQARNAA